MAQYAEQRQRPGLPGRSRQFVGTAIAVQDTVIAAHIVFAAHRNEDSPAATPNRSQKTGA